MKPLPDTENLRIARDDWVLRLTLNRPDFRNALNAELRDALADTFDAIRNDGDIRAVVIQGAGGNICAGRPGTAGFGNGI